MFLAVIVELEECVGVFLFRVIRVPEKVKEIFEFFHEMCIQLRVYSISMLVQGLFLIFQGIHSVGGTSLGKCGLDPFLDVESFD